jgi:hypothetical protein
MMQRRSVHQRWTKQQALGVALLAGMLAVAPVEIAPLAFAETQTGTRVEVEADQTITVVGEFESLKGLLHEICRNARVELRAYDADDRPVKIEYQRMALGTALASLLRRESYIVGVSPTDVPAATRVVWLRVTGGPPGVPVDPADETPPAPLAFEVPSSFGSTSFTSEDPVQRARALEAVAKRLLASDERARGVLAADPTTVAAALRGYPHAGALIRQLRDETADPETRSKLDAIIAEIE